MKTKEKSASEKRATGNRNMAQAKPVSRIAPKARKTPAPAAPSKPEETPKKKWDPGALYF